jgi:hypothetical protein
MQRAKDDPDALLSLCGVFVAMYDPEARQEAVATRIA